MCAEEELAYGTKKEVPMGGVHPGGGGDRGAGGAAEPADHHGHHGGHHDDRAAGRDDGGRSGPVRAVCVADVFQLLGLCGRRHAVFRAVLGRKGRRRHRPQLWHYADVHDVCGGGVHGACAAGARVGDGRVHRQAGHWADRREVPARGGLCLSAADPLHGDERAAALHRTGQDPVLRGDRVGGDEHRAQLGVHLRQAGAARDGRAGRGAGHGVRRRGQRRSDPAAGAGAGVPVSVPLPQAF